MRHTHGVATALSMIALVALVGCSRSTPPQPAPNPRPPATVETASPPAPTPGATTPVKPPAKPRTTTARVYFVSDEKVGVVGRSNVAALSPARGAIEELLDGPTSAEKRTGFSSAIPAGTRLRGITIRNGRATIDLSRQFASGGGSLSMSLRAAQVVSTLTQFSSVKEVAFMIEGKRIATLGGEGLVLDPPVDRGDFEDVMPAILVESPLPGQLVKSPQRISGTANTFEATFRVQVVDAQGKSLFEKTLMASSGSGTRGTFSTTVSFKQPKTETGTFIFDELSAEDGTPINIVEVPVRFK